MRILIAAGLAASTIATEPSFLFPDLRIGTNAYHNAQVRKAGPDSVIIRHADGFLSERITNLPPDIRTNFPITAAIKANPKPERPAYEPPKDERDEEYWRKVKVFLEEESKKEDEFERKNPGLARDIKQSIKEKSICIGMRQKDVVASIGNPIKRNEMTTAQGTQAQWIYDDGRYVYFRNGIVDAWSTHHSTE